MMVGRPTSASTAVSALLRTAVTLVEELRNRVVELRAEPMAVLALNFLDEAATTAARSLEFSQPTTVSKTVRISGALLDTTLTLLLKSNNW